METNDTKTNLEAYAIGAAKELGGSAPARGQDINEIGIEGFYEPSSPPSGVQMSPEQQVKKAGQHWDEHRTTLFNPKRSDPRVEAVLGKEVYNPAKNKKSGDALSLQIEKQNIQIKQLQDMVMSLGKPDAGSPTQEVTAVSYEDMKWPELKQLATTRNVTEKKKADIITALEEQDANSEA